MMGDSSEAAAIRAVFSALNRSGARYAVMRNYDSLPLTAGGSDIDILVAPDDMKGATQAIIDAIRSCGGSAFQITGPSGLSMIAALGQSDDSCNPNWWGLRVDLFDGVSFRGQSILDRHVALPTGLHGEIRVLDAGFAAVLGVLKEVLHNERVPARYFESASQFAINDWRQVESLLGPMGRNALARFYELLTSNDEAARGPDSCRRVRTAVAVAGGRSGSLWQAIRRRGNFVVRYSRPPGLVVAFMGVDGSGKSTAIEAVLPVLKAATHNAVTRLHLRPWLLPALGRFTKSPSPPSSSSRPHEKAPSGALMSLVRTGYLLVDYHVGYWLKVRPILARRPAVVIFDRYAYDMAIDQARFRIRLSAPLVHALSLIAPKPDLILCLIGDPGVIAARKGELSEAETNRQTRAIHAFAHREPRARLIKCDGPLQDTTHQVLCAIRDVLRSRSG